MNRFHALEAIYRFYDRFIQGFSMACKKGCNTCCTTNVSVTSLEMDYLLESMDNNLLKRLKDAQKMKHFIPSTTINTCASMCLAGIEPPEETAEQSFEPCPLLLENGLCAMYARRPFSCRAMSSEIPCSDKSEAYMAPFLVTVNLAIYQILEHIDATGWYGNMLDMVLVCSEDKKRQDIVTTQGGNIKTNRQIPCFIVPHEEQARFRSFMRKLSKEQVSSDITLGDLLPKDWKILC